MNEILNALILALVQGLTEFLPVSSSGHLVIASAVLGSPESTGSSGLLFEVAVHVGTLGAVVAVYREKLASLAGASGRWIASGFRSGDTDGELQYIIWIIIGTVPAAIVGLLFRDSIASLFDSPPVTSVMLVVTGLFLLLSRKRGGCSDLSLKFVILIGIAQAIAILPGCSRSGWTITAALLLGLGFESAAQFSFMLSIPAILGGLAVELLSHEGGYSLSGVVVLITGVVAAFVSGLFALRFLIYLLRRGDFHRFSWYLVPAGTLSFIYFTFIAR